MPGIAADQFGFVNAFLFVRYMDDDSQGGDDLAFRRALAVKAVLKEYGVAPWRMRIVSCSSYETPKTLKSNDRQLVIVTLGKYYLPTEHDEIDDGKPSNTAAAKPAKPSGHGGH